MASWWNIFLRILIFLGSLHMCWSDCGGHEVFNAMSSIFNWNKGLLIIGRMNAHFRSLSFYGQVREHLDDVEAAQWSSNNILICPQHLNQNALLSIMEKHFKIGTVYMVMLIDTNFSLFLKIAPRINQQIYFFDPVTNLVKESFVVNGVKQENVLFWWNKDRKRLDRISKVSFLQRRSSFQGQNLVVLTERHLPWVNFLDTDLRAANIKVSPSGDVWYSIDHSKVRGYFKTIFLDILGSQMNFSTSLYVRKDRKWGSKTRSGQWTGIFSSLIKREADIGMAALTINPSRFEVADFLIPLGTETYGIFIRRIGREEWSWQSYLKPFQDYLWIGLVLHVIVVALVIQFLGLVLRGTNRPLKKWINEYWESCWMVFGSYFGRRPPETGGKFESSQKYLLFGICLGGNVIFMAYRASLTSELSIRRTQLPFSTMEEFLKSDFKLSLPSYYDLYQEIFSAAPPNSIFNQVYQAKVVGKEDAFFDSESDGLDKLMVEPDSGVFYNVESFADYKMYQCQIVAPWVTLFPDLLSVAFPKDSVFFPFIQYQTMRLLDQGTSSRALKAILRDVSGTCEVQQQSGLGLHKLVSLFGLLTFAAVLSIAILILERAAYWTTFVPPETVIIQSWQLSDGPMETNAEIDWLIQEFKIEDKATFTNRLYCILYSNKAQSI
ncbi:probable glutamate receptor [Tigriopus californicus]|uniref:probable glutamate receptor n=1 Tax=Tigriopus californicus TaxID=6832 RepID=UPI0027DA4EC3|nr:probable glutamate receptor [Tigriopus californicus]